VIGSLISPEDPSARRRGSSWLYSTLMVLVSRGCVCAGDDERCVAFEIEVIKTTCH
jgi:hypothetical protein